MDAAIYIYTFKEGLLSRLAHDLRLTATRFSIEVRGSDVEARIDPASLRVDGAMREGVLARDELSERDKRKISESLLHEVLQVRTFPEVRFMARANGTRPPYSLSGQLTLRGITRPISLVLLQRGERLVGEFELIPSHFGIAPFRALGGALRVQDRVRFAIYAATDWSSAGLEASAPEPLVWEPNLARTSLAPPAST